MEKYDLIAGIVTTDRAIGTVTVEAILIQQMT
jgi:hypothetical protein